MELCNFSITLLHVKGRPNVFMSLLAGTWNKVEATKNDRNTSGIFLISEI